MTVGKLVYAALANHATVSALTSTRLYPVKVPQVPTYPLVRYQRISNTIKQGSSDLRRTRFQIDCWAETYDAVQSLAAAVKPALDGYIDMDQTVKIHWANVVDERDDYDDEVGAYLVSLDVILFTNGD